MKRSALGSLSIGLAGAFSVCGALSGCAGARSGALVRPAAQDEIEHHSGRPIYVPFALSTPQDAIVRVVAPKSSCSGTLVDEDLVLTAHHCVVVREDGGALSPVLHRSDELGIELGGDDIAWGRVGVQAIVTPPCGHAGGSGDVAILVLERKLVGVTTMSVRLDAPPHVTAAEGAPPAELEGERALSSAMAAVTGDKSRPRPVTVVDPVGFGRCATSAGGVHRRPRVGGPVESVSRGTFRVRASVCPGDSGGPVLVRGTSEVVGVMSMSAMDADERTAGVSVVARVDAIRPLFAHARAIADGASPAELPPVACP